MENASASTIAGWFAGRLPDGWFTGPPEVSIEGDQVVVVGTLPEVAVAGDEARAAAGKGRVSRFREGTRRERVWIAREAEHLFKKNVTWGAVCNGEKVTFTPGGSGRGQGEKKGEEPSVKIGRRIF